MLTAKKELLEKLWWVKKLPGKKCTFNFVSAAPTVVVADVAGNAVVAVHIKNSKGYTTPSLQNPFNSTTILITTHPCKTPHTMSHKEHLYNITNPHFCMHCSLNDNCTCGSSLLLVFPLLLPSFFLLSLLSSPEPAHVLALVAFNANLMSLTRIPTVQPLYAEAQHYRTIIRPVCTVQQ